MNQTINMSMVKGKPNMQSPAERTSNYNALSDNYTLEQAIEEASRCAQCPGRYCSQACPIGNRIPEFIRELKEGNIEAAYAEIEKESPLPELCSRICPQYRQCERNCTRGLYGEAVSIGKLERFVADSHMENAAVSKDSLAEALDDVMSTKKLGEGRKVAIIGSGPAGLAAASKLTKAGCQVRIYEKSDRVGGLMMYGIPNMKLEKDALERRVRKLEQDGVTFCLNTEIQTREEANRILTENDAVLLACGAAKPRDLKVSGRDGKGIVFAVDYLKANTKALLDSDFQGESSISAKGKDVIVIGGGDTGNDCLATAIRQGCKSVMQIEMMPRETDPRIAAIPWVEFPTGPRTDYGQEDAIQAFGKDPRQFLTTVKEFLLDDQNRLCSAVLVELETAIEGTKVLQKEIIGTDMEVKADLAIIAAGFVGCSEETTDIFGVERNAKGNVRTAFECHATNQAKIFVAGDMHTGQSVVAKAVRDGLDAAEEILKSF